MVSFFCVSVYIHCIVVHYLVNLLLTLLNYKAPKSLRFLVSTDPQVSIFSFCYEMMCNCSQVAGSILEFCHALCFKCIFHIGVWTFAWFVWPHLATILCEWEIWSGSNNRIMFTCITLKTNKKYKKQHHCTDFEADLYDQKPETFWGPKTKC